MIGPRRIAVLLLLSGAGVIAASAADRRAHEMVEAGRYLATAGNCIGCHTAPGGKPFAGGLALKTPFGTIVSPNITPDKATGIGSWTDAQFVRAMHDGRAETGARLYPAFPYPYYTKISTDDVLAIRAYLDTVEPVPNAVVSNQLPFPFNIRTSLVAWNFINFTPGRFQPSANQSEEWNRGAYLVEALGHCGACHTAKTLTGGDNSNAALRGGLLEGWYAPNITGDKRTGLGRWSVDDVVAYLQTGANSHAIVAGSMSEVVSASTSRLTTADLTAMAVYLKSIPAKEDTPKPILANDPAMILGEAVYADNCKACHQADGTGASRLFPALKGSAMVQSVVDTTILRVIVHGGQAGGTSAAPTMPAMPGFAWRLSDEKIAAVTTYIRNTWGNAAAAVPAAKVREARVLPAK